MDESLKNRYPFRLGTTSFIYPGGYVYNVRRLAHLVDEIELLLFEWEHLPSHDEIDELDTMARKHNISYNVHLPMDIDPASGDREKRRRAVAAVVDTIERVAPLHPTTHTLHLDFNHSSKTADIVKAWQARAAQSVRQILDQSGIPPNRISIETLNYDPFWLAPLAEMLDLSICVDVGHVILYGFDLNKVLHAFAERTTILHLHGVAAGKDHLSLMHFEPGDRNAVSCYLNNFKETVSIEVFNAERLTESISSFPGLMDHGNPKGCIP